MLNAGLFHSVKLSGLFTIDPDLGVGKYYHIFPDWSPLTSLDIDDSDATGKLYELLVAISRVVCTVILSRGPQNQQTLDQGRRFLTDNRLSVLTVLKKSAGLGVGTDTSMKRIEELADSYMLLMSVTGFIDVSRPHSMLGCD